MTDILSFPTPPPDWRPIAVTGMLHLSGSRVREFDAVLLECWKRWRYSPSHIITSGRNMLVLLSMLLGNNVSKALASQATYKDGTTTTGYMNKFVYEATGKGFAVNFVVRNGYGEGLFWFVSNLEEDVPLDPQKVKKYLFKQKGEGSGKD